MSILVETGRLLSGVVIVDSEELAKDIALIFGPLALVSLIVLAVAWICVAINKSEKEAETSQQSNVDGVIPAVTEMALVIKKETDTENGKYLPINTVLFEMNDGRRLRLRISDISVFRDIVEGQYGELRYHGKYFISFQ